MRLIFIYNAKSGLLNGAIDYVHKIVSPDTYSCSLCGLTYGPLGMKRAWADFLESLPVEVVFTYPDRMPSLPDGQPLPDLPAAVFVDGLSAEVLLPANEFNTCADLSALMRLVEERLSSVRRRR